MRKHSTDYPALDGQRARVRTTNGGEVVGKVWTRGYPWDVKVEPYDSHARFSIEAWRIASVERLRDR